jgi:hypothetical protein
MKKFVSIAAIFTVFLVANAQTNIERLIINEAEKISGDIFSKKLKRQKVQRFMVLKSQAKMC